MKKSIISLVAVTNFSLLGSTIPFDIQDDVLNLNNSSAKIDVVLEYDKEANIQKELRTIFKNDYMQSALSFERLDMDQFTPLQESLEYKYKIEAVHENEASNLNNPITDDVYIVDVTLKDTKSPVIEGSSVTITQNDTFDIDDLNIKAYDLVDGDLTYKVISNSVDTHVTGTYGVTVEAVDNHNLKTEKSFSVEVIAPTNQFVPTNNSNQAVYIGTPVAPLDRSNLNVRGWNIIANDPGVSDDTIRAYMSNLESLPSIYNASLFHTVYIDGSIGSYLGLSYSSGELYLNGYNYQPTTVLHEATHMLDFQRGFANDPTLIQIRNEELYNLPVEFSGNMRDDTYEWVANIVVFYYYDNYTLRTRAPKSYNYVVNTILR